MPDEREDEPRPARRARRRDDDYEDDYDDRPRRRRDDEDEDATGGLIPYKNAKALAAYYCGVFSLVPCFALVLGPLALIFGFLGLRFAREHPRAKGQAHAIVGIVLGGLTTVGNLGAIVFIMISAAAGR